ncbi:hypothetical protein D3C80_2091650 [compost metagenome]
MIHQLGQQTAVIAAHDPGSDTRAQDVGDRLADVLQVADSAAGFSVHSGFPVLPPPDITPPCRCLIRLMPAATTSTETVTFPVMF